MEENDRKNGIETEGRDPVTGRFIEGNPGKPKGARHITTLVREALLKIGKTEEGKEMKYEEAFIKKIMHKAIIEGDTAMIKLIWNYIDGMPKQSVEIEDNGTEDREILKQKIDELLYGSGTKKEGASQDSLP